MKSFVQKIRSRSRSRGPSSHKATRTIVAVDDELEKIGKSPFRDHGDDEDRTSRKWNKPKSWFRRKTPQPNKVGPYPGEPDDHADLDMRGVYDYNSVDSASPVRGRRDEEDGYGGEQGRSRIRNPPPRSESLSLDEEEEEEDDDDRERYVLTSTRRDDERHPRSGRRYRAATPRSHSLDRDTDDDETAAEDPGSADSGGSSSKIPAHLNYRGPNGTFFPEDEKPDSPPQSAVAASVAAVKKQETQREPPPGRPSIALPMPLPTHGSVSSVSSSTSTVAPPTTKPSTQTPRTVTTQIASIQVTAAGFSSLPGNTTKKQRRYRFRFWALWWSLFSWAPWLWRWGLPKPKKDDSGHVVFLPRGSSLDTDTEAVFPKFGPKREPKYRLTAINKADLIRVQSLPAISITQDNSQRFGRYRTNLGESAATTAETADAASTSSRASAVASWPFGVRRRDRSKSMERSLSRTPDHRQSLLANAAPPPLSDPHRRRLSVVNAGKSPQPARDPSQRYSFGRYTDYADEEEGRWEGGYADAAEDTRGWDSPARAAPAIPDYAQFEPVALQSVDSRPSTDLFGYAHEGRAVPPGVKPRSASLERSKALARSASLERSKALAAAASAGGVDAAPAAAPAVGRSISTESRKSAKAGRDEATRVREETKGSLPRRSTEPTHTTHRRKSSVHGDADDEDDAVPAQWVRRAATTTSADVPVAAEKERRVRREPGTITLNIHRMKPRGASLGREKARALAAIPVASPVRKKSQRRYDDEDEDSETSRSPESPPRRGRSLTARSKPPPSMMPSTPPRLRPSNPRTSSRMARLSKKAGPKDDLPPRITSLERPPEPYREPRYNSLKAQAPVLEPAVSAPRSRSMRAPQSRSSSLRSERRRPVDDSDDNEEEAPPSPPPLHHAHRSRSRSQNGARRGRSVVRVLPEDSPMEALTSEKGKVVVVANGGKTLSVSPRRDAAERRRSTTRSVGREEVAERSGGVARAPSAGAGGYPKHTDGRTAEEPRGRSAFVGSTAQQSNVPPPPQPMSVWGAASVPSAPPAGPRSVFDEQNTNGWDPSMVTAPQQPETRGNVTGSTISASRNVPQGFGASQYNQPRDPSAPSPIESRAAKATALVAGATGRANLASQTPSPAPPVAGGVLQQPLPLTFIPRASTVSAFSSSKGYVPRVSKPTDAGKPGSPNSAFLAAADADKKSDAGDGELRGLKPPANAGPVGGPKNVRGPGAGASRPAGVLRSATTGMASGMGKIPIAQLNTRPRVPPGAMVDAATSPASFAGSEPSSTASSPVSEKPVWGITVVSEEKAYTSGGRSGQAKKPLVATAQPVVPVGVNPLLGAHADVSQYRSGSPGQNDAVRIMGGTGITMTATGGDAAHAHGGAVTISGGYGVVSEAASRPPLHPSSTTPSPVDSVDGGLAPPVARHAGGARMQSPQEGFPRKLSNGMVIYGNMPLSFSPNPITPTPEPDSASPDEGRKENIGLPVWSVSGPMTDSRQGSPRQPEPLSIHLLPAGDSTAFFSPTSNASSPNGKRTSPSQRGPPLPRLNLEPATPVSSHGSFALPVPSHAAARPVPLAHPVPPSADVAGPVLERIVGDEDSEQISTRPVETPQKEEEIVRMLSMTEVSMASATPLESLSRDSRGPSPSSKRDADVLRTPVQLPSPAQIPSVAKTPSTPSSLPSSIAAFSTPPKSMASDSDPAVKSASPSPVRQATVSAPSSAATSPKLTSQHIRAGRSASVTPGTQNSPSSPFERSSVYRRALASLSSSPTSSSGGSGGSRSGSSTGSSGGARGRTRESVAERQQAAQAIKEGSKSAAKTEAEQPTVTDGKPTKREGFEAISEEEKVPQSPTFEHSTEPPAESVTLLEHFTARLQEHDTI
ncbi:hypothetical protein HDU96_000140 [Phlyctochytrium bullatum]|nr:hypothetical protein HDU96_000140 [Phlyctochytrium bullatum]